MSRPRRLVLAAFTSTALLVAVGTAQVAAAATTPQSPAVFVQTDAPTGNSVVAYRRGSDGLLARAGTYPTGGLGGELSGSVVDHTASQGALVADRRHGELYAVNPGSDTLSVFAVHGDRLVLRQVVGTGGAFPVSVAVRGDAVYVLDARDGGAVQGFRNNAGRLVRVAGWHRDLHLSTTGAPEFVRTPGQVAFTPDGRHLVVTTKAGGQSILVYPVGAAGQLLGDPVVQPVPDAVPFAVAFDAAGRLQVAEAGDDAVSTWSVGQDGQLTLLGRTGTAAAATCWIAASGNLLAVSNAVSASVSTFTATGGAPTLRGSTSTGPGTVDAAFTADGRFLYVQTGGNGGVDAFSVADDGALGSLGSVVVPDAVGGEGIVAW
jgi:6-phosphogluconolactonase (cycloisomerase 2 family)